MFFIPFCFGADTGAVSQAFRPTGTRTRRKSNSLYNGFGTDAGANGEDGSGQDGGGETGGDGDGDGVEFEGLQANTAYESATLQGAGGTGQQEEDYATLDASSTAAPVEQDMAYAGLEPNTDDGWTPSTRTAAGARIKTNSTCDNNNNNNNNNGGGGGGGGAAEAKAGRRWT